MATDPGTVEFLLDQLGARRAAYTTKRMFGEYCLYRDGVPVAFVCDDVLFVKDTPAGRDAVATATVPAFGPPYPGAKPYLSLAPDLWDDGAWLLQVLDATAAALPRPRPRAPRSGGQATEGASNTPPAARAGKAAEPASNSGPPTARRPKRPR